MRTSICFCGRPVCEPHVILHVTHTTAHAEFMTPAILSAVQLCAWNNMHGINFADEASLAPILIRLLDEA